MNFHMGTATGMGGGAPQPAIMGPQDGMGGGAGYCIFTSMEVVSFCGFAFTLGITGGGHAGPTHAGAAAGITIGWGAGIAPVYVSAHTIPAAAKTVRMNPRITSFLTIPTSSFRQTHYIYKLSV
jgi:hypothetical protein